MIQWNEVTWYSKLGAIILFLGVVPTLCFYIGVQFARVSTPVIAPIQNTISTQSAPVLTDTYTSQNGISGWKTYDSPTAPGGFELQYPSTWQLDDAFGSGKDYLIMLSTNDKSKIYVEERIDYNCNSYGKPVTIGGKKGLIENWNDHGSPNFFKTKEICLLDYSGEGLTFLMSAYSPDVQQTEDKIISTFHILLPGPPAGK